MVDAATPTWLRATFEAGVERVAGVAPEATVYDPAGQPRNLTPFEFGRLLRKLKIFRWLDRFEFGSVLDVAAGWEHVPHLAHERYGARGYYSELTHTLNLPFDGLAFGKLDHAVTMKLPRLPFRDDAFDVVICSEVFEHLVRPVESMAELVRVARRYVVVTTLEGLAPSRWQRSLAHHRVDVRVPHVERNFLLLDELVALFGPGTLHEPLIHASAPVNLMDADEAQAADCRRITDAGTLADALCRVAAERSHGRGRAGIVLAAVKPGAPLRPAAPGTDQELARWLVAKAAWEEAHTRDILGVWEIFKQDPSRRPNEPGPDRPVAPALIDALACPDCRGALVSAGTGLTCAACARRFEAEWGVPILYAAPGVEASEDDCLGRLCGTDTRRRRIVRRVMRRLRRNEPPPGLLRRALWAVERGVGLSSGPTRGLPS
jgi:uncharacterized protein YbaR (Trm112 family)/SAM-dependent methyltransferase